MAAIWPTWNACRGMLIPKRYHRQQQHNKQLTQIQLVSKETSIRGKGNQEKELKQYLKQSLH